MTYKNYKCTVVSELEDEKNGKIYTLGTVDNETI